MSGHYRIHLTSWENDADNYKTIVIETPSQEVVKFIVKIGKLLGQDHKPRYAGLLQGHGRYDQGERYKELAKIIGDGFRELHEADELRGTKGIKTFGDFTNCDGFPPEDDDNMLLEVCYDLAGSPASELYYDEQYIRIVSSDKG